MTPEKMAEIFEAVSVLPLRPTDTLVFRTERPLSDEHRHCLKKAILMQFGEQQKVLVLDNGARFEVIREEQGTDIDQQVETREWLAAEVANFMSSDNYSQDRLCQVIENRMAQERAKAIKSHVAK